ncbi:MAG: hypothetical protein IT340_16340 [Chloroflexi bacterium]|nr:hypothetical protein [Chloroflexota bacterium]
MSLEADQTRSDVNALPDRPDFPVVWEQPAHADLLWAFDADHFPRPIAPMEGDFARLAVSNGQTVAFREYYGSIDVHMRRINTYFYRAQESVATSDAEQPAMAAAAAVRFEAAKHEVGTRWQRDWLPEVRRTLAHWEAFDLRGASLPALLAHLDDLEVRFRRLWEIHFLAVFPGQAAVTQYIDYYRELFDDADELAALRLLDGFDNATLAADRALWRVSQVARAAPVVREALLTTAAAAVLPALAECEGGQDVVAALRRYLDDYGWRHMHGLLPPDGGWDEHPERAVAAVQDLLRVPERDPAGVLAEQAARRERLVTDALAQLASYPQIARDEFERLLRAAQAGMVLKEDHNFWIDQQSQRWVRQVLLEFGRRLADAGVITAPGDVFLLTLDDLRRVSQGGMVDDQRAVVAARKAEMEHFGRIEPPTALGTRPRGAPTETTAARARARAFGGPPSASSDPRVLAGHAGAPGLVRGPARVLHSLAESERLRPGDVLVAPTTMPTWSPLFAIAAAVVTDAGGILSHCAIVAREYGIPAVVGADRATTAIRDGQLVEVDGSGGQVRLLDDANDE